MRIHVLPAYLSLETEQSMRDSLGVESTMKGRRMRASSMDAGEEAAAEPEAEVEETEAEGTCERTDCAANSSAAADANGLASTGSSGPLCRLRAIRRLRPMCYTPSENSNH